MKSESILRKYPFLLLIPCFGIVTFVILYTIAATQYPGGSSFDLAQKGFSLMHNYWCDLIEPLTHNKLENKGRPLAVFAMNLLIVCLIFMWLFLPKLFSRPHHNHLIIQIAGVLAMIIALFLVTPHHGWVINTGGTFGSIAVIFTFLELKKDGHEFLFKFGIFCLLFFAVNFFFYYSKIWLFILPMLQKITFLITFYWFGMLSYKTYQKVK
jgi:hypothetical protein